MDGKKRHRIIYEGKIFQHHVIVNSIVSIFFFLVFHIYVIQVILLYMEIV